MKYFSFFLILVFARIIEAENKVPFDEFYVDRSDLIVHVRIVEAQELSFDVDSKIEMCGVNYKARILSLFKGVKKENVLEFSSVFPLVVSEEYLLFLGGDSFPHGLKIELSGAFENKMLLCEKQLQNPSVGENDFLLVKNYPYELEGKWVESTNKLLLGNEAVRKPCLYQEGNCNFIFWDTMVERIRNNRGQARMALP